MKYYYSLPCYTKQGNALRSWHRACVKADERAEEYAKRVGAKAYYNSTDAFAGGVVALSFAEPEKVNQNVWRFIGERDGEWLFLPNTNDSTDRLEICEGKSIPKNSNKKIYGKKTVSMPDGKKYVNYIEVLPAAKNASKSERTHAVTAEMWRLKLPVTSVQGFYDAVGADLSELGDKVEKRESATPVFFLYHNNYYIGLDFPIHQEGVSSIGRADFLKAKTDMLWEQRNKDTI